MNAKMTADNLQLGPDAQLSHAIALLQTAKASVPLVGGKVISPGIFMAVDPEGDVSGEVTIGHDGFIALNYTVLKEPRWLALHMIMGRVDLRHAAIIGVVCKSHAQEASTFRIALRSGIGQGFRDTFLPKHVVAFQQESVHVDILKLNGLEDVPSEATWRELILFFQPKSATIDIRDFRVFIV